ncbi:MAG: hypothetical protein QOJ00_1560 [Actinomycetota bacterium]|jgi:peptidoglycan/LPS O-acetylase OafA/YrhL
METAGAKTGVRVPSLDGLRGVAVLSVVAYHLGVVGSASGFYGLSIFFTLSGFLITNLLLREFEATHNVSFRRFYVRRGLRLLPALMATVAAYVLVVALADGWSDGLRHALAAAGVSLSYVANFVVAFSHFGSPLNHVWSLAQEEQFYVLWPPLLVWALRRGVDAAHILWLLLAGFVVSAGWRAWLTAAHVRSLRVEFGPDTRAGEMLIGCAVAVAVVYWSRDVGAEAQRRLRIASTAAALVLAGHLFVTGLGYRYALAAGFTVVPIATATVIGACVLGVDGPVGAALRFPVLRWFGRISYGLYLIHYPVFIGLHKTGLTGARLVVVEAVLAVALAALSFYVIEQPFLRLKERVARPPQETASRSPQSSIYD